MSDLVTIDHLSVRLGRKVALKDLSLTLADRGHVVGLFGQNGAGKSTLMRALCGLINRYTGTIHSTASGIAYLPDSSFLAPWLRIDECVGLAERLWSDFDPHVARSILRQLGLDPRLKLRETSKGMSEQIHLGLVLARRSRLYVFDEPLAAVDPLTRDRLIDMVREFRTSGSTVVISTHLISGLEGLFDEAVVVHDGTTVLHEDLLTGGESRTLEARVKEVIAADALAH